MTSGDLCNSPYLNCTRNSVGELSQASSSSFPNTFSASSHAIA